MASLPHSGVSDHNNNVAIKTTHQTSRQQQAIQAFTLPFMNYATTTLNKVIPNCQTYPINTNFFVKLVESNYLIWEDQLKQLITDLHNLAKRSSITP